MSFLRLLCSYYPLSDNCSAIGKFRLNSGIESKVVSEFDQEIPQSQTTEKPMAPRGRATQQSRDTRKTY